MAAKFKYTAFISYSHADQKTVRWLHRALETYRIPKRLVGLETPQGKIPDKFHPFFRDREDLSASTDLTKSVKRALAQSRFLIVVCSPAAARSKWVNQEIIAFKKLRGAEHILCLIVDGEPGEDSHAECFPRALRARKGQFEPIAADIRAEGDGKRLAKLKLVSGMLGLELDKLIRRETQRRQMQLAAVSVASFLGMAVLSVLLLLAVEARREAEEAQAYADDKREQAEDLVEFMLGDLKEKLEPVGNLQIMDAIAQRALGYYAFLNTEELNTESLARMSRVLLMIGEIEDLRGNLGQAKEIFLEAFKTTEELLMREPDNPGRIFDHSQGLFWLGYLDWRQGNRENAENYFRDYMTYAQRLVALEPDNLDWQIEVGYGYSNLGTLYFEQRKFSDAKTEFESALDIFLGLSQLEDADGGFDLDLAQSYAWLADAELGLGNLEAAESNRMAELGIYDEIQGRHPQNNDLKEAIVITYRALGDLKLEQGHVDTALDDLLEGVRLGEGLLEVDSENTRWAYRLSTIYLDVAEAMLLQGNFADTKKFIEKAEALEMFLLAQDESVLRWRVNLHYRGQLLGTALAIKTGDVSNGLNSALDAARALEKLQEENPANKDVLANLSYAYLLSGEGYVLTGQNDDAQAFWLRLIGLWDGAGLNLGLKTRDYLARAQWRLGNEEAAKNLTRQLEQLGYAYPGFIQFWQEANETKTRSD